MRWRITVVGTISCFLAVGARARSQAAQPLMNVGYVRNGTPDQMLDFYWPSQKAKAAVLFIHGGSLQESGERRSSPVYRDVCKPFVAADVACATMDYRLAPTHQWPAMPDDVTSAVAKLRDLIAQRGGDPKKIFLFGHSSGCQLAAIIGANPRFLERIGLSPSDLAGVVAMGCTLDPEDVTVRGLTADSIRNAFARSAQDVATYGTPENWVSGNPASYIGPHVPPMLVVLSRHERFMPPILEQGARFVRRLHELGLSADLVIVPGRHMSSIENIGMPNDPAFAAIMAFIDDPRAGGKWQIIEVKRWERYGATIIAMLVVAFAIGSGTYMLGRRSATQRQGSGG